MYSSLQHLSLTITSHPGLSDRLNSNSVLNPTRMSRSHFIGGTVDPGFESVKKLFIKNFELGSDENSQLCVYVGERKVIDLWGTVNKTDGYNADTLTTVFSSTKSITAIMMAMARDRDLLEYSDRISKHWPEFAQEGKEDITIADLMRHEAGLANLSNPLEIEDLLPENIKKNAAGEKLVRCVPSYPEGGKREYHAFSRGCLANEIMRRVDPLNRTLGEFLQKEIASKLQADVHIGCNKPEYVDVKNMPFMFAMKEGLKKQFGMQSATESTLSNMLGFLYLIRNMMKNKPSVNGFTDFMAVNQPLVRSTELPSVNGNCSARGMAVLAAALANKGNFQNTRLMKETTWNEMHSDPTPGNAAGGEFLFTKGGVAFFNEGLREGYFGWFGYGGSVLQWNPSLKIGFAYTCTYLFPVILKFSILFVSCTIFFQFGILNLKAAEMQAEVVKCLKNMKKPGGK